MTDPRLRQLQPEDVKKLLDAIKTPRVTELEGYQAFFEGNAYEGRKHFYDDSAPMHERKPIVQYPIVRLSAESNVAFALGESRFPTVLSLSSESDDVFDKALGLSKDDSATLDSFNVKLFDLARLEAVFRQGYRMAQAAKSVAFVLGFRAGLPFADLIWSKLCTPSFDDPADPQKCTRLEVRYRYTDVFRDPILTGGKWWTLVFEYLRVIDDTYDTVYKPVPIWDVTDTGAIDRKSATQTVVKHGFSFCPVHWYARKRNSAGSLSPDGQALHEGICPLLEQLDFALSQRHRAAVYAGDPQSVFSGVAADDDPFGQKGRPLAPGALPGDATKQGQAWQQGFAGQSGASTAVVKRGVMHPWRITDPQGKCVLLTLPGDALKALDDDAKDLASKICDALGVTVLDPSAVSGSGDLSGRTLAFLFSKQINAVGQDREDLGRCCILPVLNLFYRMLLSQPDGVYMPGIAKVVPVLKRFYRTVQGASAPVWFAPQLKLKWGDYFEPSDVDEATRTATAISAYTAKIITLKSAVEHVRSVFAISSVDQYVDTLADEVAQRQADAVASAVAMKPPAPGAAPGAGNPAATQSPAAAPPASGSPKPKRAGAK